MTAPARTSAKAAPKALSWAYAENFVPETDNAAAARANAQPLGVGPLGRGGAATLTFLAKAVGAKAVVEIGTGSGVSGLALFAGMQPDGVLTSVDIETDHQRAARSSFLAEGIPTQRFRLIAGSALNVLPRLHSSAGHDLHDPALTDDMLSVTVTTRMVCLPGGSGRFIASTRPRRRSSPASSAHRGCSDGGG